MISYGYFDVYCGSSVFVPCFRASNVSNAPLVFRCNKTSMKSTYLFSSISMANMMSLKMSLVPVCDLSTYERWMITSLSTRYMNRRFDWSNGSALFSGAWITASVKDPRYVFHLFGGTHRQYIRSKFVDVDL